MGPAAGRDCTCLQESQALAPVWIKKGFGEREDSGSDNAQDWEVNVGLGCGPVLFF